MQPPNDPAAIFDLPRGGMLPASEGLPKEPFGKPNRQRLINDYLNGIGLLTPDNAWRYVYRMLLWIDSTTGLAHGYESDKSQPGGYWYARALAFHDWVSQELNTTPGGLAGEIDWLFKHASQQLDAVRSRSRTKRVERTKNDRRPYIGEAFPESDEDSRIAGVILHTLAPYLRTRPPIEVMQQLAIQVRKALRKDNSRKNLLGHAFEDVLEALLRRIPGSIVPAEYEIATQQRVSELPGFRHPGYSIATHGDLGASKGRRGGRRTRGSSYEEIPEVDLVLIRQRDKHRTLVTCKWSFRADREKQFPEEFDGYSALNISDPFDYVLATNELDPGRLASVCRRRTRDGSRHLFTRVVHVNPDAVLRAYRVESIKAAEQLVILPEMRQQDARIVTGLQETVDYISSGRLSSLAAWLRDYTASHADPNTSNPIN